ncbi:transposase [Lacticaseibacillus manihotivorans DSM 13343 = JCM 12514]|uniref:Transposase n=1 Tax=Lacticaseibacillus manihotivorans DSM 13343 = JCM 12514 TaxID=1423769 RepID=A0A0R1QEA9_9LACO|nr:transposase [Lacticaseibacillus manihotivorans DSM 13343 = JCM 12514]
MKIEGPYNHLTLINRETILVGLKTGLTQTEIATRIGCSRSTVSREINRNGGWQNYSAATAQANYQQARLNSHRSRILSNSETRDRIVNYIVHNHWSPEQISARLAHEHDALHISYTTIYRGIQLDNLGVKKNHGARGFARKLRHHGKTRKVKGTVNETRGKLNNAPSIHDRPASANHRTRFGDWEGDTVHGKRGHSALITLVDRKSRYLLSERVTKVDSERVKQGMIDLFLTLSPERVRSITPDRGTEFSQYKEIGEVLNAKMFFPDPHAPQQRGTNENTNGLLREYFPKHTYLDNIYDQQIAFFVEQLNNRPRKVLGWRTPSEVFWNKKLHLV